MTDDELRKFKKRKNYLEVRFYLGILAPIIVLFVLNKGFHFINFSKTETIENVFFAYVLISFILRVSTQFINCPQCGKNFYWGGGFRNPISLRFRDTSRCSNCGLDISDRTAKGRRKRTLSEWFVIGFLGLWCIGAFSSLIQFSIFLSRATHVPGEVTNMIVKKSGNRTTWYSEVRFPNSSGEEQTLVSSVSVPPFAIPPAGTKVDVVYDPDKVSEFYINNFSNLWLIHLIFFVGSIVTGSIAFWLWKRN